MADRPERKGRYRKVEVRTWGDEKFRRLSRIPPSGKGLWLFLITGPHTSPIPGLFRAGRAAVSEELDWSLEAFDQAFGEVFREGMAEADWEARVVWLPNALKHNLPESPNVVLSWSHEWDLIPECDLKVKAYKSMRSMIYELKGEAFGKAFDKAFPKPSWKPYPKATPNQEQEQEQEQERALLPPSGGSGDIPSDLNGKDLLGDPPQEPVNGKRRSAPCPFEQIVEIYHRLLPMLPAVEKLTDKRKGQIRQRWQEDLPQIEHWQNYFAYVEQSAFLTGRAPGTNGRKPFRADIEWLTNATNFTAIAEGKYHR